MAASVITVAYHSGPSLPRLLDSLRGQEGLDEVLIVDNGGGGPEIEDARGREQVKVIDAGGNLGFAAGSNLGAREAQGATLVFLNPDTVVADGAIAQLARTLADESVGIATARLRLLDRPEQLNASGVDVHVTGIGWARGYGQAVREDGELQDVPSASGTAMAIRAETFRELGGFAEELFMYLEDLELGWRARLAGYRVVMDPKADVYHDYDYGRNPRKSYYLERNRLLFVLSSYSARQLALLAPLLLGTELGMAGMAAKEGWLRDKVAGWAWLARNSGVVRRRRSATQRLRRISDRELAQHLTPSFEPTMVEVPAALRAANPVVRGYWRLVKKLL